LRKRNRQKPSDSRTLAALRRQIDIVDSALVRLLSARARCALAVEREKRMLNAPVVDREREGEVLERVRKLNKGPFTASMLERIYRVIVRECARIQMTERRESSGMGVAQGSGKRGRCGSKLGTEKGGEGRRR